MIFSEPVIITIHIPVVVLKRNRH